MRKIKLRDKVRCKYTGFTGVVVARTEFLNGCVQFSIAPRVGKDNKFIEELGIDEGSLELISKPKKKAKKPIKKRENGGATTIGKTMRGY